MATISTLYKGLATGGHISRQHDNVPYKIENEIDFAAALAAKGSALAADDIIECLMIPAGSAVFAVGAEKMSADDATTLTAHLGLTGGDIDEWAVSWDVEAAAVGDYTVGLSSDPLPVIFATADTIDMELATLTGTLTVGKIRVWAVVCNVAASNKEVGIAQVGS